MGTVLQFRRGGIDMLGIMDVAKYIFDKNPLMSHKKLQKLCYYCQAWYLAFFEKKLINCQFEAWVHGPVCMDLYAQRNSLKERQKCEICEEQCQFIDHIYNVYGDFSGDDLELMTHNELPWIQARGSLRKWESSRNVISEDCMKMYYGNKVRNRQ